MVKEYICIVCPKGCHIKVDGDNITGYTCRRGLEYVKQESTDPKRMVTSTVLVGNREHCLCPVKTSTSISKDKVFAVIKALKALKVDAPIHIGDVIISNIFETGIDIVATKDIN